MTPTDEVLDIRLICLCGSHETSVAVEACHRLHPDEIKPFIALDEIPEAVIEELRREKLKANTVDSTAEELGEAPPDVPPPDLDPALDDPLAITPITPESVAAELGGELPLDAGAAGPDDVPGEWVGE